MPFGPSERTSFALIVLDVRMPDMDGFATAAAIRQTESTRSVPIIFVTAHGKTQEELANAYALGASDFIEKPIDPDALQAKVRVLTDLARTIRQTRLDAEARLLERRGRRASARRRLPSTPGQTGRPGAARLGCRVCRGVSPSIMGLMARARRRRPPRALASSGAARVRPADSVPDRRPAR